MLQLGLSVPIPLRNFLQVCSLEPTVSGCDSHSSSVIFMWQKKSDSERLDSNLSRSAYHSTFSFVILEYSNLELHKCKVNEMINVFGQVCRRLGWNTIHNKCTVHLAFSKTTNHTYGLFLLVLKFNFPESVREFSALINDKRLRSYCSSKYIYYFERILFVFSNSDTITSPLLGAYTYVPTFYKYQSSHAAILLYASFICYSNFFK